MVFEGIVTLAFLGVVATVMARNAYGRRHWLAWNVVRFTILVLADMIVLVLMKIIGLHGSWLLYVAIGLATPVYFACEWKRPRGIPNAVRRKVVEKWEARTGKCFDSEIYEIDHKIPFARGGWHTTDNLRVLQKNANRRKGGSEPTLVDWFRIWGRKDED